MTREALRRLGVPARSLDGVLDALSQERAREVGRESLRLAVASVQDIITAMPPATRAVAHAHLMGLTPGAAARLAQCSRRTIDRARVKGEIRFTSGVKGLVTIDGESFLAWKRARRPEVPRLASDV